MYPSTTNDQKNIIFLVHISLSSWTLGLALTTSIEIVSLVFRSLLSGQALHQLSDSSTRRKISNCLKSHKSFFSFYISSSERLIPSYQMITTRLAWGNSTSIVFCFMFIQNIYQSIWFIPNVAAIPKHCGMHVCIPSAHQYVEEELPPQMFYWLGNGVPKLHVAPSGQSPTSWIIMQLATLPPFSKRKLFWTATRSPKINFDFLFL